MMNKFFTLLLIICLGWIAGFSQTTAQPMTTMGTPTSAATPAQNDFPLVTKANFKTRLAKNKQSKNKAAQEKYLEGEIARENEDFKTAKAAFRQAIDLDIDFFAAHEQFITMAKFVKMQEGNPGLLISGQRNPTGLKTMAMPFGAGPAAAEITALYQGWTVKYPKSPSVQWGLAQSLFKPADPQSYSLAENTYRQAVAIDNKFAPAYQALATISYFKKDREGQRENLRLAYQYDKSLERQLDYADSLDESDPAREKLFADILKRNPKSKEAYSVLLKLAYGGKNDTDKLKYFEMLWRNFPDERSVGYMNMMETLFGLLLRSNPEKALELAQDMVKKFPKAKYPILNNWVELEAYQRAFMTATKAVKAKKYDEAVLALKDTKPPFGIQDQTSYYVLKAEGEGKGQPEAVYNILLKNAVGKYNSAFNAALYSYGAKIGKTQKQMDDEMWNLRSASAKVFKEFELVRHDNDQPLKLSDFRGKVVFLSFWFPGCGPCISEFPFLRAAKEKFGPRGFEMVFINIVPKEDKDALKVLAEHKMNVVSLKIPEKDWAKNTYNITGAPTNFLIDGDGKILFMPQVRSPGDVRDFEAQIDMLLNRANSTTTANK